MPRDTVQRGGAQPPVPPVVREISVTPYFNNVFYTTTGLTVFFVVVAASLALWGNDTKATNEVVRTCLAMATFGFGGIAGLLGGKAL